MWRSYGRIGFPLLMISVLLNLLIRSMAYVNNVTNQTRSSYIRFKTQIIYVIRGIDRAVKYMPIRTLRFPSDSTLSQNNFFKSFHIYPIVVIVIIKIYIYRKVCSLL